MTGRVQRSRCICPPFGSDFETPDRWCGGLTRGSRRLAPGSLRGSDGVVGKLVGSAERLADRRGELSIRALFVLWRPGKHEAGGGLARGYMQVGNAAVTMLGG